MVWYAWATVMVPICFTLVALLFALMPDDA